MPAFELVNSPVPAPTYASFFANQLSGGGPTDSKTAKTLIDFIGANGPYDVIHFNNLEGLPAVILPLLRKQFRKTRFILSLHNYYPMCPQVYLWKNNSLNCDGKESGKACVACLGRQDLASHDTRASDCVSNQIVFDAIFGTRILPQTVFLQKVIRKGSRVSKILRVLTFVRRHFGEALAFEAKTKMHREELEPYFRTPESKFAEIIEESFDVILCVSQRVKTIAEAAGLPSDKLRVSYIGTKVYEMSNAVISNAAVDAPLNVAFLGYANKVKGFEFLISTLEQCPDQLLLKLRILIAARGITRRIRNRLSLLARKVSGLTIKNGYTHRQLAEMLRQVDLGVVPVLWEDCLPQVAIEFVCNGVPIIASHLGGAREIASDSAFEFKAGSHEELIGLLTKFADDKNELSQFWNNKLMLKSMGMHISELVGHYGKGLQRSA